MIFIKVEPMVGMKHEEWAAECLGLAKRLGVGITLKANGITTRVYPSDTVPEIMGRYFQMIELTKK